MTRAATLAARAATAMAAVAVLLLAGCAGTPENVPALAQARAAVERLEAQEKAGSVAAEPLSMAREALSRAEVALDEGEPLPTVEHQAYLARRHAEIGLAMVEEAESMEAVEAAKARRRELQLEARTREAEQAEQMAARQAAEARQQRQAATAAMQEAERLERELQDLEAEETARGIVVTLGDDVLFDTASDQLKPGAERAIDRLADFLDQHPERRLLIEGHTDSRGTDAYNRDLSERRAEAVARALEERGISPDRVRPVGLGEGYPVASNDTSAGRQQNRRVEVVISDRNGRFPQEARRSVARESSGA